MDYLEQYDPSNLLTLLFAAAAAPVAIIVVLAACLVIRPRRRAAPVLAAGVVLAQASMVLLCFVVGQFASQLLDVGGHGTRYDAARAAAPERYDGDFWADVALFIEFNWFTAGYLALALAVLAIHYLTAPGWSGSLGLAALAAAPSTVVLAMGALAMLVGRTGFVSGSGLLVLGFTTAHLLMCLVCLRLAPVVRECWREPWRTAVAR